MIIGNRPQQGELPVVGKRYWWLSIGRNAVPSSFFEGGWRAFELVVMKPCDDIMIERRDGRAYPYSIRIAFAFWLPFYML